MWIREVDIGMTGGRSLGTFLTRQFRSRDQQQPIAFRPPNLQIAEKYVG